ncbi:hypothetical protein EDD90_7366 [Streptomyces sp. Ag109_O5-1]|uniref:hypothetical protein n=1 Tax=Streptomyces sp. Ag109_O5-1 TaxID=1938851 RepID=UPI000F5105DB|nr:hypothetical protein [Streptomyces sp. Ag109_O5-1]RPE44136.1 hypothetical protein EDD90_7366 [Streptomyces sp. Ag109_O5-1]
MTASCGLCEREIPDGYLCPADARALGERLERLPVAYKALGAFLAPAGHGGGERVSSGPAGSVLPVNEAVLDLRYGGIALVVEGWLSAVQEARGWGEPAIRGSIEDRVKRAARSLYANLEWVAASYPAAGDLAAEIREMERAALSIVGALPERGRRIGQCVSIDTSGVVCGAVIRQLPHQTRLVCDWCRCVYSTPQDWALLAHYQPGATPCQQPR